MFDSVLKPESRRAFVAFIFWGAVVFGVLQVHRLPAFTEPSICSPAWGCGPPLNALISYHGFWLVLFASPIWLMSRLLTIKRLHAIGSLLATLGVVAVIAVVIWQAINWLPTASEFQRGFFIQRCLFKVAVMVDVPTVQVLLAGFTCLFVAQVRHRQRDHAPSPLPDAEPQIIDQSNRQPSNRTSESVN